MMELPDNERHF